VTPPHTCAIQAFTHVAWQRENIVLTSALGSNARDATRHGTAELGKARTKHRFVYCCVIAVFTEALLINSLSKSVTTF
jgi:hypothetical protein